MNHQFLIPQYPNWVLQAFTDSDWTRSLADQKSTGGYDIFLWNELISWSYKKQRIVSRSSTESEYKALIDVVPKLTWVQSLLFELSIPVHSSPVLWCDNLGDAYLSINCIFHACTNHVEIDYHFDRDKVTHKDISVQFLSTKDQLAYVLTKPTSTATFEFLCSK